MLVAQANVDEWDASGPGSAKSRVAMGEDRRGSACDDQDLGSFGLGRGGRVAAALATGSRTPPPELVDQER